MEWNPQTVHLASSWSVEAEAIIPGTDFDEVESGLSQISCVYSFTVMAETLHDINDVNGE